MEENKKEFIVIRLPKPKNIERVIWVILVLLLVGLVFWNPFKEYSKSGAELSGAVASGIEAKNETVEALKNTTLPEVTPVVEKKPEVIEQKPAPVVENKTVNTYSGEFYFDVLGIVQDPKTGYTKIKSVNYKIDNQKKDYNLLMQVMIYKSSDPDTSKEKVRGESNIPVKLGKLWSSEIPITTGTWLPGDTVNVKVVVKDLDKNEVLTTKVMQYALT